MDALKTNADKLERRDVPLVSVCLLTYQHAKYIEDCLKSILDQSYPCIELVVLDDASTDGTADIISGYAERFEEKNIDFHFIRHEVNAGNVPTNCNEMVRASRGKYLKLLSGDDMLLDCCVTSLVEFLETTDCSIVYANGYIVDDNYRYGERFGREVILKNHHEIPKNILFERLLVRNYIPSSTAMIPRWIYDKYGMYDENIGYEDYDLWLRVAAGGGTFAYLNRFVYLYRKSETGLSNCNSRAKFAFMYNETIKILKKHMIELSPDKRKEMVPRFYKDWMGRAKEEQYLDIYMCLQLKYVRWLLRNKLKKAGKSNL